MLIQTDVGQLARQSAGTSPNIPGGMLGELLQSPLLPDYYTLAKNGKLFSVGTTAINPAAFVGGAAGTPIVGLYNPQNSGVDLVLMETVIGIRTTGTAAVATDFNHWGAVQGAVIPSGTVTAPRNLYSLANAGSAAVAMVNTANTGALASTLIRPAFSIGLTAATAITNPGLFRDELKGEIIIAPGNYYAFGLSVALTAASIDAALIWAELPV